MAVDVWTVRIFSGLENKLEFRDFETKLKLSLELQIFVELIFLSFGSSVVFLVLLFFLGFGRIKPGWSVSILFKFILSSFLLI